MPSRTRTSRPGFSLLEACAVVCVVGIVLATFLPTFLRKVRASKSVEAAERLGELHQGTAAYFASRRCLPEGAGPSPDHPSEEPVVVDFQGSPVWRAVGFVPSEPLRFRYSFRPEQTGCNLHGLRLVTLRAEGDLDADGVLSTFERSAGANRHGELVPVGTLRVVRETE